MSERTAQQIISAIIRKEITEEQGHQELMRILTGDETALERLARTKAGRWFLLIMTMIVIIAPFVILPCK